MDTTNYPVVNIEELRALVTDAAPTRRPTLVLSPPGYGKTETGASIARALGLTFVPFELGLTVPEEVGGVPVRDPNTGAIVRFPLGPIRTACERPSLLLIDEVTRADATRQGAAMTGVNERRWGDYQLHPETIVLLAGNEPDSGGVFSILDALLNRCCVVRLRTAREEIQNYLRHAGAPPLATPPPFDAAIYAEKRANFMTKWADYADGRPEMIASEPPRGFSETGALYPSGRAVVHACERLAARAARGLSTTDAVALAHVSGVVGRETGVLFLRLEELAGKLPTPAEINKDPKGARLPPDIESAVASLSLLPNLDNRALWIYLGRYGDNFAEISAAAAKRSIGKLPSPGDADALKAFNVLNARIHRALSR